MFNEFMVIRKLRKQPENKNQQTQIKFAFHTKIEIERATGVPKNLFWIDGVPKYSILVLPAPQIEEELSMLFHPYTIISYYS